MVRKIRLSAIGEAVGAPLPKDLVDRFHLQAGDELLAVETTEGILLTPFSGGVDTAAEAARRAEAHRQAAAIAASDREAEDQAFVDSVSEFNEESGPEG